jgi:hypothetical protein
VPPAVEAVVLDMIGLERAQPDRESQTHGQMGRRVALAGKLTV